MTEEGFEESALCRQMLAPRPGQDRHQRDRERLRNAYLRLRENIASLATEFSQSMLDNGVTDISHMDALWDTSMVCGDAVEINPAETYVLGAGIAFHDAGQGLVAHLGGSVEAVGETRWRDLVAGLWLNAAEIDNPSAEVQDADVWTAVRLLHSEQAMSLVQHNGHPGSGTDRYLIEHRVTVTTRLDDLGRDAAHRLYVKPGLGQGALLCHPQSYWTRLTTGTAVRVNRKTDPIAELIASSTSTEITRLVQRLVLNRRVPITVREWFDPERRVLAPVDLKTTASEKILEQLYPAPDGSMSDREQWTDLRSQRLIIVNHRSCELARDLAKLGTKARSPTHHLTNRLPHEPRGDVFGVSRSATSPLHGMVVTLSGDLAGQSLRDLDIRHPGFNVDYSPVGIWELSRHVVDLGDVDLEQDVLMERIRIIDRSGGALDWSVESAADWVEATRSGSEVVLRLHPRLGVNDATVDVFERRTGTVQTIDVKVRVRRTVWGDRLPVNHRLPVRQKPVDRQDQLGLLGKFSDAELPVIFDMVRRQARSLTHGQGIDPDDITQDAMLALSRMSADRHAEIANVRSYLWSVVRNITMASVRSASKAREREVRAAVHAPDTSTVDDHSDIDSRLMAQTIVAGLGQFDADVLNLRYHGYQLTEIARMTNVSYERVRHSLRRIGRRTERILNDSDSPNSAGHEPQSSRLSDN